MVKESIPNAMEKEGRVEKWETVMRGIKKEGNSVNTCKKIAKLTERQAKRAKVKKTKGGENVCISQS